MKRMNANKDIVIPLINKHLLDLHSFTFWQWGEFMIMDQNISGDICIIWSFRSFFDHKIMEDAEELGWGWMTGSNAKCWYIQWQCRYHLFCSWVCNRNNTVHNFKCSGDITKYLWIVSHNILVSVFWKRLNWITKKIISFIAPNNLKNPENYFGADTFQKCIYKIHMYVCIKDSSIKSVNSL